MAQIDQRARLEHLLATGRRLIAEARLKCHQLDEIWAARKEAKEKGRRRAEERLSGKGCQTQFVLNGSFSRPTTATIVGLSGKPLLIIVEDDPDDLDLLQKALTKAGLSLTRSWATRGTEALEMVSHLGPEISGVCFILDVRLPDMSGFELLERIRSRALPIPIRFVFLTGDTHPETEARARLTGADGFFRKTCNHGDLLRVAKTINGLFAKETSAGTLGIPAGRFLGQPRAL